MHRIFPTLICLILTGCGGSNDFTEDSDTVTVFKSTGAVQCEPSGMSAEESAQFLIDNGIDVISSYCGFETNLAVATVCGAGTTDINLHVIRESYLTYAEDIEYFDVLELENDTTGSGYEVVECENI